MDWCWAICVAASTTIKEMTSKPPCPGADSKPWVQISRGKNVKLKIPLVGIMVVQIS